MYGKVDRELRAITVSICATESDLDYAVIHPDKSTFGICGIKLRIWEKIIPEINIHNVNSLYAGSLVIKYLLDKNNGNLALALKEYKGAERNLAPVKKVLNIYKQVKKK